MIKLYTVRWTQPYTSWDPIESTIELMSAAKFFPDAAQVMRKICKH